MDLRPQQARVPLTDSADYRVSPNLVRVTARARANGFNRLIGLQGLPSDFALLLAYIILDGGYTGDEAHLGIKIGPIPIFVTDVTLMAVIAISVQKHAGRLLNWVFTGSGAGASGRAVWLLFLITLVYFALA